MAGKLSKQELKEPDKFQVMLAKGMTWLTEHKQKIYIASGIVTVILLVAAGWYIYSLNYEKSAQQIYARVYGSPAPENPAKPATFIVADSACYPIKSCLRLSCKR